MTRCVPRAGWSSPSGREHPRAGSGRCGRRRALRKGASPGRRSIRSVGKRSPRKATWASEGSVPLEGGASARWGRERSGSFGMEQPLREGASARWRSDRCGESGVRFGRERPLEGGASARGKRSLREAACASEGSIHSVAKRSPRERSGPFGASMRLRQNEWALRLFCATTR
jgi:hypothetical protein